MMKSLVVIALLFINTAVIAQADSTGLKQAMQQLDKALVEKDSVAMIKMLHKDVRFGHSNGWVQNKTEMWNDCRSGRLVYQKFDNSNVIISAISKKSATVTCHTNAEGLVNGNTFKLTMHVMQVWTKTKGGWQLLARQSAKLQ
jgi:hypothetical protein